MIYTGGSYREEFYVFESDDDSHNMISVGWYKGTDKTISSFKKSMLIYYDPVYESANRTIIEYPSHGDGYISLGTSSDLVKMINECGFDTNMFLVGNALVCAE